MPGSTNFIQVNPTLANQETDSAYAANSLTTGGISVDAILPSPWLNKFYYQASTFIAAFAQMMANKGYNMSDASIGTLEAVLAHVLTDADTKTPLVNVTFSSTIVFDASIANGFVVSLSGNVTASSVINMAIGQTITIVLQQDGVGTRTFATPPQIVSGHWLPVRTGASAYTVQQFQKTLSGDIVRVDTADIDFAAAIATINGSISTINGQIATINGSISSLNSQVATLNGQVSTINSEITTINGEISTLFGDISGINSQLSLLTPTYGSNANGFYRKDNYTGVIEQWGSYPFNLASGTRVNFPISYTDATTISIQCLEYNPLGGTTRTPAVVAWDTAGWTLGFSGGGSSPMTWYAIGK